MLRLPAFNFTKYVCVSALLLLIGSAAHANTLWVKCGSNEGLTSIGAAIKVLQRSEESQGPSTINVSGACNENIVIQGIDRLTLNAINGASITDASGGTLDVIRIEASREIAINNFTINGGDNGIDCANGSLCRLSGNTIQRANIGAVALYLSQIVITGGTLQNNAAGLVVINGSNGLASGVTIQNNDTGVTVRFQAFLVTDATITNNGSGFYVTTNGTVHCNGCRITGNGVLGGALGVLLRRNSSAMFENGYAITGNAGGGVLLSESSSAFFQAGGTVTGNTGGLDVLCGSSYTTGRGATTNIGGGTTNCVEPPQ
jgi:hypothetical protein